jgi:hypothetical protein
MQGNPPLILFKLNNMADCIGQLIDETDDSFVFRKLRLLQYQQAGQEIRIGFMAFMIAAEDANITLPKSEVLCYLEAPSKIADGYTQAVSPIQLSRTLPHDVRNIIDYKPN